MYLTQDDTVTIWAMGSNICLLPERRRKIVALAIANPTLKEPVYFMRSDPLKLCIHVSLEQICWVALNGVEFGQRKGHPDRIN